MVNDFRQFQAWQKAMDLSVKIYRLTEGFPKCERFGLVSQLRRASVSVAANIAEGFGRYSFPDKQYKYVQARGELVEVMTELTLSSRVGYLEQDQNADLQNECGEVHKILNALISKMYTLTQAS
ncbi:MAG: four helix bundle protein [Candidatus Peribacteraceae bacterium]|nr:four helix bundle protein [Candidatus Peribacteraceae bacterium]